MKLVAEIAEWMIVKLRKYSVNSLKQIEDKEKDFGDLTFSKFVGNASTAQMVVSKEKVESFLRKYLGDKKYRADNINELVTAAKYVSQFSMKNQFFEFVAGEGGTFRVDFAALKADGNNIHIFLCSYTVEFGLAPDTSGWGIFKTTKHKDLSNKQREDLESFLLATALKSLRTDFGVDLQNELPAEYRKYLE